MSRPEEKMVETRFSAKMRLMSSNGNVVVNDSPGADMKVPGKQPQPSAEDVQAAYQRGVKETTAKLQGQISQLQAKVSELANGLPTALNAYFEQLEEQVHGEVLELSLAIAEIIIGLEPSGRETVEAVIAEALSPFVDTKNLTIRLNPEVAASFGQNPVAGGARIAADPGLGTADVVVECGQGVIDATIAGRLKTLGDELRARHAG